MTASIKIDLDVNETVTKTEQIVQEIEQSVSPMPPAQQRHTEIARETVAPRPTSTMPPPPTKPPTPPSVASGPDEEPKRRSIFNRPARQEPRETHTSAPPPTVDTGATERRFTLEQWEQLGADAEAVAKQMRMLPPREIAQHDQQQPPMPPAQQPAPASATTNSTPPVLQPQQQRRPMQPTSDIAREAKDRLERMARNKAVDYEMRRQSDDYRTAQEAKEERKVKPTPEQEATSRIERKKRAEAVDYEMRRQSPEYDEQAKRKEVYAENAKAIREMTEAAREEKIALSRMTEEQRIAYLAQKEANRQQERDAVKQRAMAIRKAEEVPLAEPVREVKPLHDDKAYRRRVREDMAQRERSKRYKEIRREMDPEFAQEEQNREDREKARTMAMGGAAIGGKIGRVLGIASQVMASPAAMKMVRGLFDKQKPKEDEGDTQQPSQAMPPPPAANIPENERVEPQPRKRDQGAQQTAKAAQNVAQQAPKSASAGSSQASSAAGAEGAAASEGAAAGGVAMMAAEAVPVIGAAIAAKQLIDDMFHEGAERNRQFVRGGVDASKAVLSMDPQQQMQLAARGVESLADAASKASPALGMIAKPAAEFVMGVVELTGSVKSAAQRLAQFSPQLAEQGAQQEVQEIMREINRSGRFGPQMAATDSARFNLEQKVSDIADRLLPFVLKILEKIFALGERGLSLVDDGFKGLLRLVDEALIEVQAVGGLAANWGPIGDAIVEIRRLIGIALRDNNASSEMEGWNNFMSMGNINGLSTITPMPAAPGPAIQAP